MLANRGPLTVHPCAEPTELVGTHRYRPPRLAGSYRPVVNVSVPRTLQPSDQHTNHANRKRRNLMRPIAELAPEHHQQIGVLGRYPSGSTSFASHADTNSTRPRT